MYLYFFDRILRAAAGDPNLVLPYWNWGDPAQRTLPLPFCSPADSSNALYVPPTGATGRLPGFDAGTSFLSPGTVDSSVAFADVDFDTGGSLGNGFGSGPSSPKQFSNATGDLENTPHNAVHDQLSGLMGNPDTAAEDPIFWLHHAQIDRLWNRWIQQGGGRADPTDASWLNTTFTFYDEAGHTVSLTGAEVVDTVNLLNYRYDDDPPAPMFIKFPVVVAEGPARAREQRINLGPSRIVLPLIIGEQGRQAMAALAQESNHEMLLRIRDVRAEKPSGYYYSIYLRPASEQDSDLQKQEGGPGFVGNLTFFSTAHRHRMAEGMSMPEGTPEITLNYDVTTLAKSFWAGGDGELSVVLVPRGPVDANGDPVPIPKEAAGTIASVELVAK